MSSCDLFEFDLGMMMFGDSPARSDEKLMERRPLIGSRVASAIRRSGPMTRLLVTSTLLVLLSLLICIGESAAIRGFLLRLAGVSSMLLDLYMM
ncbi:hypothetical protein HAX54_006149, partial [Datura stramonium]|nr:hypothetical protein [Datura stramonium]